MFFWRIYEYPLILVGFWKRKGLKSAILGSFGVLCRGIGTPCSSEGPHHGVAEWEASQASGTPRRSHYLQHGNVCVLFRFTIPLFQGLVYWTNEDLISV